MKKPDGVSLSDRETWSSNYAEQQFLDVITIYHNQQNLEGTFLNPWLQFRHYCNGTSHMFIQELN